MVRSCDICGTKYVAKRQNSMYCGPRCGQRAHRMRKAEGASAKVIALIDAAPELVPGEQGPVEVSTLQTLTACDVESTPLGTSVLALARRIDLGFDTGAGLAALVKQFEQTLRSATSGVLDEAAALDRARDELASRRGSRSA